MACEGPGQPVTVNGVAIDESSYIRSGVDPSSFAFKVKVTAGHIFVLGDNRANSATYWPLNRVGALDAHHDVFKDVPEGSAG